MSDLHCAARILLACPGEAEVLGQSLASERLALVYTAPQPQAVRTADAVAARTGATVVLREVLAEGSVVAELDAISDVHRGETVLVVLPGNAIRATVPALVGVHEDYVVSRMAARGAVVELAADADGWALRHRHDDAVADETVDG